MRFSLVLLAFLPLFASLYPLILSLAIGTAPHNTIQASARATLASGTAILALPLVLGRLADGVGIRPAYGVVVFLLIGAFMIILGTGRHTQVQQQRSEQAKTE